MVKIAVSRFADKIKEYLLSPEKFRQEAVVDTLNVIDPQSKWGERKGITFGYNTGLVMQLLARAYHSLSNGCDTAEFSVQVAQAVQNFAEPFSNQDNLCYPHFLFHGLVQQNLDGIVEKLECNSRIIHETFGDRNRIMDEHGYVSIDDGLTLAMSNGATDDFFGIAYLLARKNNLLLSSACGYVAKASFFVDITNKDIYVMTLQGRRFDSSDLVNSHSSREEEKLEAEREYSRIGNVLGMSPRRFILEKVMDFGRENGFTRIKVIKPEEHPMFIERHKGFLANYEPVIRKAGITEENGCYLEKRI